MALTQQPTIAAAIRAATTGPPAPRPPADPTPRDMRPRLTVIDLAGVVRCTHCCGRADLLLIDPARPTAPPVVVHMRGQRVVAYCDGRVAYAPGEPHGLTPATERFLVRAVFGSYIAHDDLTTGQLAAITNMSTARS